MFVVYRLLFWGNFSTKQFYFHHNTIRLSIFIRYLEIRKSAEKGTKLIVAVKLFKYEEKLKQLNLPTLKYRRIREDIIDMIKVVGNVNLMIGYSNQSVDW